uniref:Uncharacterized protein n=1 Tax=Oncorhynchus kisutch TaxID=8019 RepID=A0A8C7KWY1_ONCKI
YSLHYSSYILIGEYSVSPNSNGPLISLSPDILNIRRRYHRHHCPHRRCMPLHSRVPFP